MKGSPGKSISKIQRARWEQNFQTCTRDSTTLGVCQTSVQVPALPFKALMAGVMLSNHMMPPLPLWESDDPTISREWYKHWRSVHSGGCCTPGMEDIYVSSCARCPTDVNTIHTAMRYEIDSIASLFIDEDTEAQKGRPRSMARRWW